MDNKYAKFIPLGIGIAVIVIGVIGQINNYIFIKSALKTEATITDFEDEYIYITYNVNNT